MKKEGFDYSILDPGIRETVKIIHGLGWETTVSGDGYSKKIEDYPGALPYPYVSIELSKDSILKNSYANFAQLFVDHFRKIVKTNGYNEEEIYAVLSYSIPEVKSEPPLIILIGMKDEYLNLKEPEETVQISKKEYDELCKLRDIAKSFVREQEISCSESIWQTEWVIDNTYAFIEAVCENVGYYKEEEEEE